MLLDYLVFNAPVSTAKCLLDTLPGPWSSKASPTVAYQQIQRCGGVSLSIPTHQAAPIHVNVTGKGCRELEAAGMTDWRAVIGGLLDGGAKFSRIDFALDDHPANGETGLLDLDEMIAACQGRRAVLHYRSIDLHPKLDPITGTVIGRGISFGNRQSDTCIRIYDKALQLGVPGHWIRVELEAHGQRAQALAKSLVKTGAGIVPSVLLGYLDFKEAGQTSRRSRQKSWAKWTAFLGTTQRCRLEVAPRNVSRDNTYHWLIRHVSPSFARLHDGGMGDKLVQEMLTEGRMKLQSRAIRSPKAL